jgi:hypothetical protein
MPTPTYIALANITLGSSASSVTFSSIPATFRDLVMVFVGSGSTNADLRVRLNGDTGSNYSFVYALGAPPSVISASGTQNGLTFGAVDTGQTLSQISIMDYSATDKHKTALTRWDSTSSNAVTMYASRWANTSAVNTVVVFPTAGTLSTGVTVALYGIAS